MNPPRLPGWLLRWLLPAGRNRDVIRGDLLEEFRFHRSPARYWREALSVIVQEHRYRHMLTLDNLRQDVRFAWRSYRKAPSFTVLVVFTLALGIGASTAIFSIVNGVLLRPLALHDPDRLVWMSEANERGDVISASWMNYVDWRARSRSFERLAASRGSTFDLTGLGQARRVTGRFVTSNFFDTLGTQPFLGRSFVAADEQPGAPLVVIVSHEFWQRHLAGDTAVLGRSLTLDGRPHTIVGVLPSGFRYLRRYDMFTALGGVTSEPWLADRGNHQGFVVIGRLRPAISRDAAVDEVRQIEADLTRTYPATNAGISVVAEPLAARLVKPVRETLLVLFGAVGILLLIACVNVAGLLIARGAARQHELALRAALGGRRSRLLIQMLVESTMLSLAGGALGAGLAALLLRLLLAVAPPDTPRLDEIALDGTALAFAVAAAIACGLLFGLLPAWQASRSNAQRLVVHTRAAGASASSHRLRRVLMAVEVALALVLLAGAGLMLRTLGRLTGVDTGLRPDHVLTARLSIPEAAPDHARRSAVTNAILARVRALPGVEHAGVGFSLPIDGSNWNSVFWPQDKPLPPTHDGLPRSAMVPITAGYLEALGIRTIRGRAFDARDTVRSTPVTIVNETLASHIWPGQDPIGKHVKQGWPESPGDWREVVGVVADVKFEGVTEPTTMQMYLPMEQDPSNEFFLAVRAAVDPASLAAGVGEIVGSVDRDMPIAGMKTMEQVLGESLARQRMALLVLSVFAIVALVLASVGLYGVVSHSVTERRHEIGVRLALGAAGRDVVRLVVRGGMSMAGVGAAVGLVAAAFVTKTLSGLLFGVEPLDPLTFGLVAALLLLVAALACSVPAWRATRLGITAALRAE